MDFLQICWFSIIYILSILIYIAIYVYIHPLFPLAWGLPPPGPPARAGGRRNESVGRDGGTRPLSGKYTEPLLMGLCIDDAHLWPPKKCLKLVNLINFDPLWAWQNLWGYGRIILTKFWPLGTPWDLSYDNFWVPSLVPSKLYHPEKYEKRAPP